MTNKLEYITNVLDSRLQQMQPLEIKGRVLEVIGTLIKAVVPVVEVGEICELRRPGDNPTMQAEVVGFSKDAALLTPLGPMNGLSSNIEVIPTGQSHRIPVGPGLLGRVLNGLGQLLDEDIHGPLACDHMVPVYNDPPNPLKRQMVSKPLSLGVKAIDGILTCGEGQRMGIFAAAGGGKSTLLAMLVKGADVDVTVVALIGERGREVREFIERELGPEGMAKSVLVVATSDKPAMERLKAAHVATAVAEYFRDQGKRVLLLMDSVTRFARAQREIGLAAGEPPTRRGFPPSVFSALPALLERTGPSESGSITALYTVLVEGDDMTEPVADETRSILDGHIILSRKLAAAYHYPAIDIMASVSRVMGAVASGDHNQAAGKLRQILARYQEIELLVQIGEYKRGNDPKADEALDKIEAVNAFLKQKVDEHINLNDSLKRLMEVVA